MPKLSQKPGFWAEARMEPQKPGFLTKSGVTMPELSQKPGFLDGRVGSQKLGLARSQTPSW
ncbi:MULTISPECIES: hypothetical protein [unclassified Microcoleus]|uniref:hypothetical protein n=1 Tax=unclassified Microcoleus TaxID=2642155 RepID=UPI002FD50AB6